MDELYEHGFIVFNSEPGEVTLDFISGNLFDPSKMILLPHDLPGPDNHLNDKLFTLWCRSAVIVMQ